MTPEHKDRLCRIWDAGTAVLTAAAGGALMAGCLGIYRSGEGFSREAVSAAFSPIKLPVYLCLGAVLGGFAVHALCADKKKSRPPRQTRMILKRMQQKKDISLCNPALHAEICRERKKRRLHSGLAGALTVLAGVAFLLYALQPAAFDNTLINESVIRMMQVLLPCMLLPGGYGIFAAYFCKRSMEKEIALLKNAPDWTSAAPHSPAIPWLTALRLGFTCLAVILIVIGLATGGIADVLTKAINICTECVGLG